TLVFAEEPFTDWLYFIDARSGEVLEKQNRIMDAIKSPGLTDLERVKEKDSRDADAMPFVTGTGKAYPTHPGISSVSTKNFYRLNGNGSLQGTYAYVLNDDGAEAYSAGHDFQYSTGSTHFDEANLYYHVDNFRHNFIAGLGSLGFTQITAHAHAYNPYYGDLNAWFSAGNQHIYFGDAASSGSYNNFAREDKIVYHEYGHAVIYDIQSGISSSSTEEGAISEGTPDYFAGSFTGRSVIGDYAAPSSQRDMSDPDIGTLLQYEYVRDNVAPIGSVTPHTGGEFFSSILWDIRNSAGISAGQTDYLVFEALDGITGNPNFLDFRDAMMAADNAAYSGAHNDLIQNTFANKGIGNST
ncbi:MAG: M36 family metallopeptidase, partial [Balneolaceae bacterium]